MANPLQKLVAATVLVASVSAFGTAANAGTLTLKSPTIGGTASTDYLLYDADSTNTFQAANTQTNLEKVLSGDRNSPTGNVELAASSERAGFDFSKATTLDGTIGGKTLTLSSLTQADWTSTYKDGLSFGQFWFNEALTANKLTDSISKDDSAKLFSVFQTYGGFQRFSDPNIAYVNQDSKTGLVQIGLAGHFDATPLFTSSIQQFIASASGDLSKAQSGMATLTGARDQAQTAYNQVPQTIRKNNKTVPNPDYNSQRAAIQAQINDLNGKIATAQQLIDTAKASIAMAERSKSLLSAKPLQASEVFKYTYNNGETQYGYSFNAVKSGLVEKGDGISHSGTYEVEFKGLPTPDPKPRKVPEPSIAIGLVSLGGLMALKRRVVRKEV